MLVEDDGGWLAFLPRVGVIINVEKANITSDEKNYGRKCPGWFRRGHGASVHLVRRRRSQIRKKERVGKLL